MQLVHKIESMIEEQQLLQSGNTIIVAVSGGADSVALLHILHTLSTSWKWSLIVAHVNHQFRGLESDQDAEAVQLLANTLQLKCEIGLINVPKYIEQTGMNAQVAAREKRYEFLWQVAMKYGADHIALAHHADDQAETIMMRILRGTGPAGLSGIPIRRTERKVELVRPLIRIHKTELIQYIHTHQLSVCEDGSNEQRKYFRNQVRHDVLPFLLQYNKQLPQALNRLSEMMQAENDYLDQEAKRIAEQIVTFAKEACHFSIKKYASLHVALQRRLINLILSYLCSRSEAFDFNKVEFMRSSILQRQTSSLMLDVGCGIQCIKDYDSVRMVRTAEADLDERTSGYQYTIRDEGPQEIHIPEFGAVIVCQFYTMPLQANIQLQGSAYEAIFDVNELEFPLYVRSRCDGDRMEMMGLKGSKKVKDILIDNKIIRSLRDSLPLLVDRNNTILWIPAIRRSRHALVGGQSTRVVYMQLKTVL